MGSETAAWFLSVVSDYSHRRDVEWYDRSKRYSYLSKPNVTIQRIHLLSHYGVIFVLECSHMTYMLTFSVRANMPCTEPKSKHAE